MIKLQDIILQSDTRTILDMLKFDLAQHGVDRFHLFRNNGDNIQTNCPFHKDGRERKPSFGVNGEIDKCHCFACGWSGTIEEMISELYGYQDEGNFGKRWLIKRFNSVEIETRPSIMEGFNARKLSVCNNRNNNRDIEIQISEAELDKYRYIHPYMYERGLTDEIIERFDIGYDRQRDCITFPIKDINGKCVFVATRSTKGKFFGLPKGYDKPVYQANQFSGGCYGEAYITESFLNCLTCWKYDKPSMAMIGTGTKNQYDILNKLPVRVYILCFDPDEAGRKATERFKRYVHGKIIKELVYPDSRDINELQEEFLNCKIIF